ncbi:quinone oxidoreductase family protein [Streptomyces sp. CA-250714]|uniref:quinone oxidoreductase family protein n=1 Tax=Streptomyces sp. CA-250714 TaxID=3240060 RepID=UPI003D8CBA5B
MRRVRHTSGTLTLQEVPRPVPGPGELLIRTEAIGVTLPAIRNLRTAGAASHTDAEARTEPQPVSGEVAGTIEAVGPAAGTPGSRPEEGLAPGDRVTGLCFGDAYAEFALLHTSMATPVPAHATAREAVALLRGGLVAIGALEAAGPRPGETALITAAAGGAGHLAVQLARLHGGAARVVAAVSDPGAKGAFLRDLGADAVIGYDDLGRPDATEPADYVLDAVGGELLTPAVRALADHGRLIAYSSGGGTVDAHQLLIGAKSVTGFQIGRTARDQPDRYAAWCRELWRLHAAGTLRAAVAAALPLERAAEAHDLIQRRANLGKVLLIP